MPKFNVTIFETTSRYANKVFDAETAGDARRQAEAEDWSTENGWQDGRSEAETYIDDVEEVS